MSPLRISRAALGVLPLTVLVLAAHLPATAATVEGAPSGFSSVLVSPAPATLKSASTPAAPIALRKAAAPSLAPMNIIANACSTGCARDPASASRPLIASLPAGESFELRILKDARQGFRLRASSGNGPASADERLRIQLSRRYVGIGWSSRF